jgi:hypothetical protein
VQIIIITPAPRQVNFSKGSLTIKKVEEVKGQSLGYLRLSQDITVGL